MIADVAALVYQAMGRDATLDVMINNRVYGNHRRLVRLSREEFF